MEETTKLREFKVRIRGNKINMEPFAEVFVISAKNRLEAGKLVDEIMKDTSSHGRLYKYGHCEERFATDIEAMD